MDLVLGDRGLRRDRILVLQQARREPASAGNPRHNSDRNTGSARGGHRWTNDRASEGTG